MHKRIKLAVTSSFLITGLKILSSFLFGFAALFTVNYSQFMTGISAPARYALLAGAFGLFSALAYWAIYRFAPPRFQANDIGPRRQALILLGFLLAGMLLVLLLFTPGVRWKVFLSLETVAEKTTQNPAWFEWVYARYGRSLTPQQEWYTWRPALYLYLFLFGVAVTAIKKGKRYLLLAVPVSHRHLPADHPGQSQPVLPLPVPRVQHFPAVLALPAGQPGKRP